MRRLAVLTIVGLCACGSPAPTLERVTLAFGTSVEIVELTTVLGPGADRYTWVEYRSSTVRRDLLAGEIREVWEHFRAGQEKSGIPLVFVDASAPKRSVVWNGIIPGLALRERGCISFTRVADGGWKESPVGCCLMGPCDARGGGQIAAPSNKGMKLTKPG